MDLYKSEANLGVATSLRNQKSDSSLPLVDRSRMKSLGGSNVELNYARKPTANLVPEVLRKSCDEMRKDESQIPAASGQNGHALFEKPMNIPKKTKSLKGAGSDETMLLPTENDTDVVDSRRVNLSEAASRLAIQIPGRKREINGGSGTESPAEDSGGSLMRPLHHRKKRESYI